MTVMNLFWHISYNHTEIRSKRVMNGLLRLRKAFLHSECHMDPVCIPVRGTGFFRDSI